MVMLPRMREGFYYAARDIFRHLLKPAALISARG